jgi:hypothetical protein
MLWSTSIAHKIKKSIQKTLKFLYLLIFFYLMGKNNRKIMMAKK